MVGPPNNEKNKFLALPLCHSNPRPSCSFPNVSFLSTRSLLDSMLPQFCMTPTIRQGRIVGEEINLLVNTQSFRTFHST